MWLLLLLVVVMQEMMLLRVMQRRGQVSGASGAGVAPVGAIAAVVDRLRATSLSGALDLTAARRSVAAH